MNELKIREGFNQCADRKREAHSSNVFEGYDLSMMLKEMKNGIEIGEEAKQAVKWLESMGEQPKISIDLKYLDDLKMKGGKEARTTWLPSLRAIVGTIGVLPYGADKRVVFTVVNPKIQIEPRATGGNKKFHGVIRFCTDKIELKDLVAEDSNIILLTH